MCSLPSFAQQLLLDVRINGQKLGDVVAAQRLADGRLALTEAAWSEMRLRPAGPKLPLADGAQGYALESLDGVKYALDSRRLQLDVTAPATAFSTSSLAVPGTPIASAVRPEPGIVINYDAVATGAGAPANLAATVEAIAFGPWGSLVTSALVSSKPVSGKKFSRLETYWQTDFPDRMESLVIGDTVGTGGGWSRPVRYGGVRYGRDFSLKPGFVTVPQATLNGSAALPSAVEVMVNGQQRMTRAVAPGAFEVTNVPLVSGAGEVNLVVRDLLGRETVVKQSYYSSPTLLAPGLSDYQVEAGKLRTGYGTGEESYGDTFATATWRQGITPGVTAEVRGEAMKLRQAAGIEMASLLGNFGAIRAVLAASRTPDRSGLRWGASMERSAPAGGFNISWDGFAQGFTQFAAVAGEVQPRNRLQMGAYMPLWGGAGAALTYAWQQNWNAPAAGVFGAVLSMPVFQRSSMALSFSRQAGAQAGWRAGVAMSVPLDNGSNLYNAVDRSGTGRLSATVQAAQTVPSGPGLGWYLKASNSSNGSDTSYAGGVNMNTARTDLSAEVEARSSGPAAARVGMRGSVGYLGGLGFASRSLGREGFAVVRVGDLEGVPVMRGHQVVTHTGAGGYALVPGLLAYDSNLIQIDPAELPMDVQIGQPALRLTPYARSGVVADFAITRERSALVQLMLEDGSPVPAGARVTVAGSATTFLVARRGEVYVTGWDSGDALQVQWSQQRCAAKMPAGASATAGPQTMQSIGPLACFAGPGS